MECEHCNGRIGLGEGIYFRSEMYHRICLDKIKPMWRYPQRVPEIATKEVYQEI